ncbi:MAG: lectin-like protein, partial [Bacteroidota bacterium]
LFEKPTSNETVFFTNPQINCPSNIEVTAAPGQNSKTVSWNEPTATTPCRVNDGSTCSRDHISGFRFLGKNGNSKYYRSHDKFTFSEAKRRAEQNGGKLAVICSSSENNFIRHGMNTHEAWIGYTDENREGHFRWIDGTNCSYTNWKNGEPNDVGLDKKRNADYAIIEEGDGKWRDRLGSEKYRYIMEIVCNNSTRPGNVTVAQIAGPANGSAFQVGTTTTIRYRATDECGRSKTCSFTVKVNSGGSLDPCANKGGDSDGDGICDNDDNCRFIKNADQADNDGDGIGNVCDDTPNGGGSGGGAADDCKNLSVTGGDGKFTVSGIKSANTKIEYIGAGTGFAIVLVCDGNCGNSKMVTGLSAGQYTVKVQTFNPYCFQEYTVNVTGGGGGGNPCDNRGGDSDGDGICDNDDNCRFTRNADQADNDGDGIGNVCDDTPNGGGNGGGADDCKNLSVSGGDGKFTVSGIKSSNTKIEYIGAGTGYAIVLVCNGNCGNSKMVTGLSAGQYTVKVQTFNPYCFQEYTVNVTGGGGGGNPCDNRGGDSDGDGVCDNDDNCRFTQNPDQADNDGDGIGNVCDDTPNGGGNGGGSADCDAVQATGGNGKITVTGANQGRHNKIEIIGAATNFVPRLICDDNCTDLLMIDNVSGEITVKIQITGNDGSYCYTERVVNAGNSGGGGNSCANRGGDSDGDGICDNDDNCRFTRNADQADNDGDGIGNVCDDTPNGGGGGSGDDCKNLSVTGGDGKFTVSGIKSSNTKIEYSGAGTGYAVVLACEGNCGSSKMVTGLAAGEYTIKVQTFNPYCYAEYKVNVTGGGGSGNPCDNRGGDSDGDGICDNDDNCRFTQNPDQADNDGDGIGNVCDDTPNGGGNGGGSANCDAVQATGGNGKITVTGANQGRHNKIEIIGAATNFVPRLICDDNCTDPLMITNVSGEITVKIQITGNDGSYCYAERVVNAGNGGGDPCANKGGDSDGDGICDNDDNCRFTKNANQADNDGDGIGNVCDDTPNGGPSVCVMRNATNTSLCERSGNTPKGTKYGAFILLERVGNSNFLSKFYTIHDGKLTEFSDGTAKFTGRLVNRSRSNAGFNIDVHFSGRTRNGSPKEHECDEHQSNIYFYANTGGRLNGTGILSGLHIDVKMLAGQGPFQIGNGGNVTSNNSNFGGSGWLDLTLGGSTSSGSYRINAGNQGQNGDFNVMLSGGRNDAFCGANSRASLFFTAFEVDRQVALQWATNTTFKNDYYVIEKSTDGVNFTEMAKVDNIAAHDEMETFKQIDQAPSLGENYYRVKQVYWDGSFDYTGVELINFNIDLDALQVFPNPVKKHLFISLAPYAGKEARLILSNQYGQIVREMRVENIDAAPVQLELEGVQNGLYFLTVQPSGGLKTATKRVVVGKLY